jgi:alkanesulfonate monooxygenase SsuD/methylene tetrahydromethanopterin reductase-like flavin-dependent oxidoreductase (luciferase family)
MQFVLMTEPHLGMTFADLLGAAKFADEAGLEGFARSDHYLFPRNTESHATDAFATLAGLARETSRVELVVLVAPITFRHPAVLAKMATTIDEMSDGRLALGVGTGWMTDEHETFGLDFPELGTRFEMMEEALGYLWHALGRKPGPFEGKHYQFDGTAVHPLPTGSIPLIVGGSGEKRTPRLAGTYADEYNFGHRPIDAIKLRIERARAAAEKAGRDPAALRISIMTSVAAGMDEDGFRRLLARIAEADPMGRDAEALEKVMRERNIPMGTSEQVREEIHSLEAAGVDRLYVQHLGPFDRELLEELFAAIRG